MVTILRRGALAVAALAAAALLSAPAMASAHSTQSAQSAHSTQAAHSTQSAPRTADPSRVQCPTDTVCFFTGPFFSGTQSDWPRPSEQYCDGVPDLLAQSVINNSAYVWKFYPLHECRGVPVTIGPGRNAEYLWPPIYSWSGFY